MPGLLGRAGKKLGMFGVGGKIGATALVGGSAAVGGIASLLDTQGPYQDVQRMVYGDENAFRAAIRGGIKSSFDRTPNIPGPSDSYYGRPVNVPLMMNRRRSSGSMQPVPGESVFGAYHLRRGY